jgi:hypothetical protein
MPDKERALIAPPQIHSPSDAVSCIALLQKPFAICNKSLSSKR